MKIEYLAHSAFAITTSAGTRIVTDPFDPRAYPGKMSYRPFHVTAHIVTCSHEHSDHNAAKLVEGAPKVIRGPGRFTVREVSILGVAACHDAFGGSQRGSDTIFVFDADGLRIAHMGDLGHVLTAEQASQIGEVDIALIPVGGTATISGPQSDKVADQVNAKIVIPMHFATDQCSFPTATVEDFLKGKSNVKRLGESVLEVTKESLPASREIIVPDYSQR